MKRLYYRIRFKILHIPNALVRLFTKDNYYVCEECHHIHKRDSNEIRLDGDIHNMSADIWYGSVARECYINQQIRLQKVIREMMCKGGR